jgi:hypothetical protein
LWVLRVIKVILDQQDPRVIKVFKESKEFKEIEVPLDLEDLEAGEGAPCLGDQEANPEGLGACPAERSFQEEEGVACSYLEVQGVHPCLGVEEAFPCLVVEVAFPCLAAGVACPFLEEEEAFSERH